MNWNKPDFSLLPEIVCDEHPEYLCLYRTAWEQVFRHAVRDSRLPAGEYMDEGTALPHLWLWDSCFMALLCKYAGGRLPGLKTLDNLYTIMYHTQSGIFPVHHADNPPLFAWVEYENLKFNGDLERIERILGQECYLQKHWEFFEHTRYGTRHPFAFLLDSLQRNEDGYLWSGIASGMDNTPRGEDCHVNLYWVDALAQQALAALSIRRLAEAIGHKRTAETFQRRYRKKCLLLQQYWDEHDGCYYDRYAATGDLCRILTPASFWPLLAEAASPEQAIRQSRVLTDPQLLGGIVPLPSVARNSRYYDPRGGYWRGAVWLPSTCVTVKALEKYGMFRLATEVAATTLDWMVQTWDQQEPHSIWECYAPEKPEPGTNKWGNRCRSNFCGWSALGPISLLIENVIGIVEANALTGCLKLRGGLPGRRGVRNFRFGQYRLDIIIENNRLEVVTEQPLRLETEQQSLKCIPGKNVFDIRREEL